MVAAMILAGGSGTRVGADRPKQFVEIYNNKPVLAYTVEIYQNNSEVDVIEIVCHSDWMDYVKEMVSKYGFSKVKYIVVGGETFQKSVINGVRNFDSKLSDNDIVMIHYGASPFTTQNIVADSIKVCREYGMAASCTPCYQLMGTNDADNKSINWVDRDKFVQIACPQSFKYGYLKDIYKRAAAKKLLDSIEPHTTSLMYALGDVIYQSYGNQTNIKITTKEDLELFKAVVINRSAN